MMNVGKRNKKILVELLQKAFDRAIAEMPDMMIHNFTKEAPFYDMTLRVTEDRFCRSVLEREVEDATKHAFRATKALEAMTEERDALAEELESLKAELVSERGQ